MLSRFAIARPIAILMVVLGIFVLGFKSVADIPVDMLPDVTFPVVQVSTELPNASPEEVENSVTRVIEEACSRVSNVDRVESVSTEGVSSVVVFFKWGQNIDLAAVDVREKIDAVLSFLPDDAKTPTLRKWDPNQLPVLILGCTGGKNLTDLRHLADDIIAPRLEATEGVAVASVQGGYVRQIRVRVDASRLRALNIPLTLVTQRLAQENLNVPAGLAKEGQTEYLVRTLGLVQTPEQFGNIVLTTINGRAILLRDVASVEDSHEDARVLSRMNQQPSVTILVSRQSTANTVATVARALNTLKNLRSELPANLQYNIAYNQATLINNAIGSVKEHAIIGACLAVLILLFFLRNIRSTLIIALSIPISILATFIVMYMGNLTMNIMTLGGLALGVGLIVDDAIVVLENIYRRIHNGESPKEASLAGAKEIGNAVAASTFTVMIVFLPMIFVSGMAGKLFGAFALTVIFSIAISLLTALTVVPALTSRYLKAEEHHNGNGWWGRFSRWAQERFDALDVGYRGLLQWALNHRGRVLAIAGASLVAALFLFRFVGTELLPSSDTGYFSVYMKLPIRVSLEQTQREALQAEHILRANPDVDTVFTIVGQQAFLGGAFGSSARHVATFTVSLKPKRSWTHPNGRTLSVTDEMAAVRRQLSGLAASENIVFAFDMVSRIISGGGQDIQLYLYGDDLGELTKQARAIKTMLAGIPGVFNLTLSSEEASPEIHIVVDRDRAAAYHVSFQDVAKTVETATKGATATRFLNGGRLYDVVVDLPEGQRTSMADIRSVPITTPNGVIRLDQVANVEYAVGPNQITRRSKQRDIIIQGAAIGRSIGDINKDIETRMQHFRLPEGYYWKMGGAGEEMAKSFASLGVALLLAIILVYMVLAAQYESLIHPLAIMFSLPLAVVGVALALLLSGKALGVTAFIGIIMLVGIVVKNAILLVDYTNHLRAEGMDRRSAILQAGPTRLRPILMTTCATILGMLPIALALGEGTETQAPMAIAVIGGLATSTVLTLIVVPVIYTLLEDWIQRLAQRKARLRP